MVATFSFLVEAVVFCSCGAATYSSLLCSSASSVAVKSSLIIKVSSATVGVGESLSAGVVSFSTGIDATLFTSVCVDSKSDLEIASTASASFLAASISISAASASI